MLCGNRISRANAKERYRMAPLPRKTSCAAQVALQHCPILHMSKRKSMIPTEFHTVNWLNLLRKPGSKPSGQVAQFTPDRRLRRTGISKIPICRWSHNSKVTADNNIYDLMISFAEQFLCPVTQILIILFKSVLHPFPDLTQRNAMNIER